MQPTGVSKDSAVWFVEVNGQSKGPFTLEQISDAFHSGQLQARLKVSSEELNGKFMTVEEAADLYQRRTGTGTIHLPPRPSELVHGSSADPTIPPPAPPVQNDPAHSLFEVLQTVKDRKPTQSSHIQVLSDPSASRNAAKIPGQVWLILSITLVLGVSGWVLAVLMKRSGEIVKTPPTETVREVSQPAARPAAPIAPATNPRPVIQPPRPAPKFSAKPFMSPIRSAVVPKFTPAARDDRDRDRDRGELDRDERDRDERDRDERDPDGDRYDRDPRDDDPRDWRAKDDQGNDVGHTDRFSFGGAPGTEPGGPHLHPAPAPVAPPPRLEDPDHPAAGGR